MSGPVVQSDLAFVRLGSGEVVRLDNGDPLPEGVDDVEVKRLTSAGVIGEPQATEPDPVVDPVPNAKPRGGRS